ncbi:MAG: RES family NAD+ phosphorylase, partial [Chloroflexia bacterium]|nr:RES family NAD+ phosphorylase [Chloroflexia bacterium]
MPDRPEWHPPPLPEPPLDLARWELPTRAIPLPLYQCYRRLRGPLNDNRRSTGRFNAPAGEFGVAYLSDRPEGAFAEKFLQSSARDERGSSFITQATLDAHRLCAVDLGPDAPRVPRVVDLTANGPLLIGADGRLCASTDDPGLTQRWALALWRHPTVPDGLAYPARHDAAGLSVALFDRAGSFLVDNPSPNLLHDPDQLMV